MAVNPLTVANIRRAQPGDILRDAEVHGLHLRVFPTKAVYSLHYRSPKERKPNGKPVERRLRLGPASAMSLPEIRAEARRALAEVAKGNDPALSKRQHTAIPTIDAFFETAHKGYWSAERYKLSGWSAQVRRFYEHDIRPTFGGRPITDSLDDLEEWHESFAKLTRNWRPNTGNRALAILSTLLNLAETARYKRLRPLNSNPCTAITRHPERKRRRFATADELIKLGKLLIKYAAAHPREVAFIYILLYSGSRPRAVERAEWSQLSTFEVEGVRYGVLRQHGKTTDTTGDEDAIFIPPQGMAAIDRLPRTSGTITGVRLQGAVRDFWHMLRTEAGCPDLWLRDFRRTFATVGMSGGQAMSLISELLNHKTTQTTKTYALLMDDAKQKAASEIAGRLETLLSAPMSASTALSRTVEQ